MIGLTPRTRAIQLAKQLVEGGKIYTPVDYLAEMAAEFLKAVEWRPIETATDQTAAPWDGNPVLICTNHNIGSRVHRAIWTDVIHGSSIFVWAIEDRKFGPYPLRGDTLVTHWLPLPEPPQ